MQHVRSPGDRRRSQPFVLTLALVGFGWLALVPHAHAEELGTRQNLVFSAERLFGFQLSKETIEVNGRDITTDQTVIGIGWSAPASAFMVPRLGIDYFISSAFTLGGNVGFASRSIEDATATAFLLGLRVGYAVRLGHSVSIWPRGGFSYSSINYDNNGSDEYTFALTFDVPFSFALTEGFAFTIGPCVDIGFIAERGDRDASEIGFGLMVGLAGWTNL